MQGACVFNDELRTSRACMIAELHTTRVAAMDYRIRIASTGLSKCHAIPRRGRWATTILMEARSQGSGYSMCTGSTHAPKRTSGPEPVYLDTYKSRIDQWTSSRRPLSLDRDHTRIVLRQAINVIHWVIDYMIGIPHQTHRNELTFTEDSRQSASTRFAATCASVQPPVSRQRPPRI